MSEAPFIAGMEREVTVETGRKAFRLDGMLDRLIAKARGALEARQHDRGPDPDANIEDEERITIPVRWLERAMKSPPNGHGSITSSKLLNWLVTINIAVTIATASWVASTIIEQGKAIAVLQCQLNPQNCPQVNRGRS